MNENLRSALVRYFMSEFDDSITDANRDANHTVVGLAYTSVYDEQENEHDLQVELHVPSREIVFYLDGSDIGGEKYSSDDDIAYDIDRNGFDDWIWRLNDFTDKTYM